MNLYVLMKPSIKLGQFYVDSPIWGQSFNTFTTQIDLTYKCWLICSCRVANMSKHIKNMFVVGYNFLQLLLQFRFIYLFFSW